MPEVELKFRFIRHIERTERKPVLSVWSVRPDGRPSA